MALKGLAGRTALVTGAGGGIGAAIVDRLLGEGCNVMAADVSGQALGELAAARAGRPLGIVTADLSTENGVATAVEAGLSAFGKIDHLANSLGILGKSASISEHLVEDFDAIYRVNMRGVFLAMNQVLRHMIERRQGGAIVNISSIAAERVRPGFGLYSASKAAVIALTKAAAAENGQFGIRVNAVTPGSIATPMLEQFAGSALAKERAKPPRPIERLGTPGEVADLIAFLLSDNAVYCTGGVYPVDGGMSL